MSNLVRPPVVVILGHVDHGKTTLLDAMRDTSVQATEAGGITQHISSHVLNWQKQDITFLDTPGHEVFGLIRTAGGQIADIAILVVAATDSLQPQTLDSIKILKENHLKFIVAVTKTDLDGADVLKIKADLAAQDIYVEGYGGDVPLVEVIAPQKKGIDELLNTLLLYSEMEDVTNKELQQLTISEYLTDLPVKIEDINAYGHVLDSDIKKGKGKTGYFILQYGSIKPKDTLVIQDQCSRIKISPHDKNLTAGYPFQLAGIDFLPLVGERFLTFANVKKAHSYIKKLTQQNRQALQKKISDNNTEDDNEENNEAVREAILDKIFGIGTKTKLKFILKADTVTTLHSIVTAINKLEYDKIDVSFIHQSVGDVNYNDIDLAENGACQIISFNTKVSKQIIDYAEKKKVPINQMNVIYDLIDFITEKVTVLYEKQIPKTIGSGLVKQVFILSNKDTVAGMLLEKGFIEPRLMGRIVRNKEIILEKIKIKSMKVLKDEKTLIKAPKECGINLGKNIELLEGDTVEFYELKKDLT